MPKYSLLFLGRYLNLDVSFVHRKSNSIRIFLKEYKSDTEVPPGIRKNFGTLDYTFKEIRSRPDFWTSLVERYRLHRYERVNLNKDVFEVFLSGEIPDITSFFEASAGKPIREISLCELFVICKKLISTTQLASDIERTIEGGKNSFKNQTSVFRGKSYLQIGRTFFKTISDSRIYFRGQDCIKSYYF